jgi:threonine dehydrogenase-like Zn-dependent dehydrogenase
MRIARRAVLVRPGSPIEVWEGPVPTAAAGEVVVSVEMAGVCGTDHHLFLGEVELPGPVVLGHEGIGRIEELGPAVSTDYAGEPVQAGDLVYWMPMRPCHRCYACTVLDDVSLCPDLLSGMFADASGPPSATYADCALLPAGMPFFRIPPDTPSEAVIAFGCAMPTMLQAMERLGEIRYGETVLVQGCGPVGLAAVLLSRLAGAGEIVVIGAPRHRLEMAAKLGATTVIDLDETPSVDDRVSAVVNATLGRGAEVVIEAAGKLPAFAEGLRLIAPGGRYLVVGLWSAPGTVSLEPRVLNNANLRIIGSALENPRHIRQAVAVAETWHSKFPLADVVSHRFRLEESQQALEAVGRLETVKAVIVPA